jgi:serine/threonine-protein kinase
MGHPTAEKVGQRAFDLGLLNERQLQEVWATLGSRSVRVEDFTQLLVRREFLTNYQVERLMKGERSGYFFGPYKVQYLVGTGTFARVYRAVHKDQREVVAVKVLRNRFSDNAACAGLFLREGKVGCNLRHPNIVQIHDVCSEKNTHFLVMEFVEGRNLREFVKIRKKLAPAEAIRLIVDMTEGLRHAFEHGITHRDLKMTNVLVSSRGQAKLVDFGLATIDEAITDDMLGDLPNTRAVDYAALERATGVRKDDTRSDIYFLGCIFYHMLTGLAPLAETQDRLARLSKQRFLEIPPLRKVEPDVPDAVALVVNKAMCFDPGRRYQSPSAMLADLRLAAERLAAGGEAGGGGILPSLSGMGKQLAGALPEPTHSVMVVESNAQVQDVLRKGLRNAGYRVLLTADPARAVARFRQDAASADCVIFNAQELGETALEGFNQMAEEPATDAIPAVLLLDQPQHAWKDRAKMADRRVVLTMPITMRQLRESLSKLVALATGAAKK